MNKIGILGVAATLLGAIATLVGPLGTDSKDDDSGKGQAAPPSATVPASPSANTSVSSSVSAPQEQQATFREVYAGRTFKLRTSRSKECLTSFVDFDKGRAATGDDITPDEAEIALQACMQFGLWINATSAGVSSAPIPSAQQCLEYARQGGFVGIDGYDQLKEEDPIKRGTTLCFETDEGLIVRAVAEEVRWTRLGEPSKEWAVDYTFKATAWQP
ncbi:MULTISPECIES: hypothetical protein [Streptomyces]|uniref:hypothetical protein n=1 Tax=Streptomyces TaxID=1883 RepID=UPI001CE27326|nr:hypothetical protein [Streptomyces pseudogriseolus]